MRAKELIPIAANTFGFPFEAAYAVDRALAEAGLRAKGRGRALPDMSREEFIVFLLAMLGSSKASRAHEAVQPLLTASVRLVPDITDRLPFIPEKYHGTEITIVQFLLELLHVWETIDSNFDDVILDVSRHGNPIILTISIPPQASSSPMVLEVPFLFSDEHSYNFVDRNYQASRPNFDIRASVHKAALDFIAEYTEDPIEWTDEELDRVYLISGETNE